MPEGLTLVIYRGAYVARRCGLLDCKESIQKRPAHVGRISGNSRLGSWSAYCLTIIKSAKGGMRSN